MMYKKFIKDDIYGQGLWLFVGDRVKINKYLTNRYNIKDDEEVIPNTCAGLSVTVTDHTDGVSDNVIYIERFHWDEESYKNISHEVFHHVSSIFDEIDVKYVPESGNEAFAYYTGYIFGKIMVALRSFSDKDKKKHKKTN